jgi:peroxiredoxin
MHKHSGTIILFLLPLLLIECGQKGSPNTEDKKAVYSTEISGHLQEGNGASIILEEMGARVFIPVDTVSCDETGRFHIALTPEQIAFYVLRYGPSGYITLLMEPGESVQFTGQSDNMNAYTIKGSPGSSLLQTLAIEHKQTLEALGEITRMNREYVSSPDYPAMKQQFDQQFDSITSAFHDYSLQFIHKNANSPAILIALYNLYGQGFPVFYPDTDFATYNFVDSALMTSYSEVEAVQLLHAQVTEAEQLRKSKSQPGLLKKGRIASDFVSSRPDGSQMALSDLKGNYVLLAFWASWSKLCREENKVLARAMERFGEHSFRILQVSLDDDKEAWTLAIDTDHLYWDHVSDLKRWETQLVNLYGVEKIPFNVMIDPSGKIIETDLYGEQLLNKLDQLFNN